MKITTDVRNISAHGMVQKDREFSIAVGPHIMSILSNLYTNPVEAMVREYMTNMYDAYLALRADRLANGLPPSDERPPEIIAPNILSDPMLIFKDYGIGMDMDTVWNVFTSYGQSTKSADNYEVGGFGIGAKVAFCYNEGTSWSVESRHDGQKHLFIAYMNSQSIPSLKHVSSTPTDEPSGVTISIPINPSDTREVHTAISKFSRYFPMPMVIDGMGDSDSEMGDVGPVKWGLVGSRWRIEAPMETSDSNVVVHQPYKSTEYTHVSHAETTIVIGNVPYPMKPHMAWISVPVDEFDNIPYDSDKCSQLVVSHWVKTVSEMEKKNRNNGDIHALTDMQLSVLEQAVGRSPILASVICDSFTQMYGSPGTHQTNSTKTLRDLSYRISGFRNNWATISLPNGTKAQLNVLNTGYLTLFANIGELDITPSRDQLQDSTKCPTFMARVLYSLLADIYPAVWKTITETADDTNDVWEVLNLGMQYFTTYDETFITLKEHFHGTVISKNYVMALLTDPYAFALHKSATGKANIPLQPVSSLDDFIEWVNRRFAKIGDVTTENFPVVMSHIIKWIVYDKISGTWDIRPNIKGMFSSASTYKEEKKDLNKVKDFLTNMVFHLNQAHVSETDVWKSLVVKLPNDIHGNLNINHTGNSVMIGVPAMIPDPTLYDEIAGGFNIVTMPMNDNVNYTYQEIPAGMGAVAGWETFASLDPSVEIEYVAPSVIFSHGKDKSNLPPIMNDYGTLVREMYDSNNRPSNGVVLKTMFPPTAHISTKYVASNSKYELKEGNFVATNINNSGERVFLSSLSRAGSMIIVAPRSLKDQFTDNTLRGFFQTRWECLKPTWPRRKQRYDDSQKNMASKFVNVNYDKTSFGELYIIWSDSISLEDVSRIYYNAPVNNKWLFMTGTEVLDASANQQQWVKDHTLQKTKKTKSPKATISNGTGASSKEFSKLAKGLFTVSGETTGQMNTPTLSEASSLIEETLKDTSRPVLYAQFQKTNYRDDTRWRKAHTEYSGYQQNSLFSVVMPDGSLVPQMSNVTMTMRNLVTLIPIYRKLLDNAYVFPHWHGMSSEINLTFPQTPETSYRCNLLGDTGSSSLTGDDLHREIITNMYCPARNYNFNVDSNIVWSKRTLAEQKISDNHEWNMENIPSATDDMALHRGTIPNKYFPIIFMIDQDVVGKDNVVVPAHWVDITQWVISEGESLMQTVVTMSGMKNSLAYVQGIMNNRLYPLWNALGETAADEYDPMNIMAWNHFLRHMDNRSYSHTQKIKILGDMLMEKNPEWSIHRENHKTVGTKLHNFMMSIDGDSLLSHIVNMLAALCLAQKSAVGNSKDSMFDAQMPHFQQAISAAYDTASKWGTEFQLAYPSLMETMKMMLLGSTNLKIRLRTTYSATRYRGNSSFGSDANVFLETGSVFDKLVYDGLNDQETDVPELMIASWFDVIEHTMPDYVKMLLAS